MVNIPEDDELLRQSVDQKRKENRRDSMWPMLSQRVDSQNKIHHHQDIQSGSAADSNLFTSAISRACSPRRRHLRVEPAARIQTPPPLGLPFPSPSLAPLPRSRGLSPIRRPRAHVRHLPLHTPRPFLGLGDPPGVRLGRRATRRDLGVERRYSPSPPRASTGASSPPRPLPRQLASSARVRAPPRSRRCFAGLVRCRPGGATSPRDPPRERVDPRRFASSRLPGDVAAVGLRRLAVRPGVAQRGRALVVLSRKFVLARSRFSTRRLSSRRAAAPSSLALFAASSILASRSFQPSPLAFEELDVTEREVGDRRVLPPRRHPRIVPRQRHRSLQPANLRA